LTGILDGLSATAPDDCYVVEPAGIAKLVDRGVENDGGGMGVFEVAEVGRL
jgi:hypothetical protein